MANANVAPEVYRTVPRTNAPSAAPFPAVILPARSYFAYVPLDGASRAASLLVCDCIAAMGKASEPGA